MLRLYHSQHTRFIFTVIRQKQFSSRPRFHLDNSLRCFAIDRSVSSSKVVREFNENQFATTHYGTSFEQFRFLSKIFRSKKMSEQTNQDLVTALCRDNDLTMKKREPENSFPQRTIENVIQEILYDKRLYDKKKTKVSELFLI